MRQVAFGSAGIGKHYVVDSVTIQRASPVGISGSLLRLFGAVSSRSKSHLECRSLFNVAFQPLVFNPTEGVVNSKCDDRARAHFLRHETIASCAGKYTHETQGTVRELSFARIHLSAFLFFFFGHAPLPLLTHVENRRRNGSAGLMRTPATKCSSSQTVQ